MESRIRKWREKEEGGGRGKRKREGEEGMEINGQRYSYPALTFRVFFSRLKQVSRPKGDL